MELQLLASAVPAQVLPSPGPSNRPSTNGLDAA